MKSINLKTLPFRWVKTYQQSREGHRCPNQCKALFQDKKQKICFRKGMIQLKTQWQEIYQD